MSLTTQQRSIAAAYLEWKASVSKANDSFLSGVPRAAVPPMSPIGAVATYQTAGNPYTGDPLWGIIDFYTDPRRLQAALNVGPSAVKRLFIDCDDVAGWYFAAVRQMTGYSAYILTLIDSRIVGSHVICVYTGPDGKFGAMDTNGHHVLPNLDESTICDHWTAIYHAEGYHYIGTVVSPYPF